MTVTPARRAALQVLRAVRRGQLADRALARAGAGLAPRDRAWLQELAYGTLRLRGRLDHLLAQLVRRGLEALEPDVLDALRLGAYQLLEMRGVPSYAAVSQTVELAKSVAGPGAAALVNGVLHALIRRRAELRFPSWEEDPVGHLVTWGSHPRWLVERWLARYGPEETRALVEANNRRPGVYVRPVRMGLAEARARLADARIRATPVPLAPDVLHLEPPSTPARALALVPAVVQDPAASLVVRYAAFPPGRRLADLAAAPGGKAIALAESARHVVASDVSWGRLRRLRENAARIGHLPLSILVADARRPPIRPLDGVLLDVPCTGTGTFRRHPDARWRIGPADLEALVRLQREMLDGAAAAVLPGGLLVYATCSLEPEENEQQVDAFLERHPEYELLPPPPGLDPALLDPAGRLLVLPHRIDADGAFAARLRRRP